MTVARREPLPDFRALCESACIKLWGEPTSRDRKELRWDGTDDYSAKTFSFEKKAWYDHGAGWGGGLLDLVSHAKGAAKQDLHSPAFFDAWREAHAMGLVPDPPPEKKGTAAARTSRPTLISMRAANCCSRSCGSTPPIPRTVSANAARTAMAAGFGIPAAFAPMSSIACPR